MREIGDSAPGLLSGEEAFWGYVLPASPLSVTFTIFAIAPQFHDRSERRLLASKQANRCRVIGCCAAVLLALGARATTARAAAASELDRAAEVQQSIQKRFWDSRRLMYVTRAGHKDPAEMWAAGVTFSALDAASRHFPSLYRQVLSDYFHSLDRYWDRKQPQGGYEPLPTDGDQHDKYYDDNAWMAITFAEAYEMTGNTAVLARARQTTDFVLSGWDDALGGGIWWHERHNGDGKNTCVNAPGAVACLMLARCLPDAAAAAHYRKTAADIVAWTRLHLQNPDGRYADNIKVSTGRVERFSLTYNTALMIRANLMLARQSSDAAARAAYQAEAEREAHAADAYVDAKTGAYHEIVKFSHLLVEADLAVARSTADAALAAHLRKIAHATVDVDYTAWKAKPSEHLIDVASVARELWLVVESDSTAGQEFWRKMDGPAAALKR